MTEGLGKPIVHVGLQTWLKLSEHWGEGLLLPCRPDLQCPAGVHGFKSYLGHTVLYLFLFVERSEDTESCLLRMMGGAQQGHLGHAS